MVIASPRIAHRQGWLLRKVDVGIAATFWRRALKWPGRQMSAELQPDSLLSSNLRLLRELGRGAMGTVWLAEQRSLGSQVAVKVLNQAVDGSEARARFEQEARALAQLDSPHVVRVFDFGTTADNQPYIVMERLQGQDLLQCIDGQGRLSLDDTADIISQVCLALSAAHRVGIVHRDIKPANIFLTDVEGTTFVKVLDFGVAKFNQQQHMAMTATGAMMGTPYYMSPEQLLDPRNIDHRSDLWSLGVVAYACISGTLPFQGETVGALSVAISKGTYPPLSAAGVELSEPIDAWFDGVLKLDRDKRFDSAREMAAALREAVEMHHTASSLGAASAPAPATSARQSGAARKSNQRAVAAADSAELADAADDSGQDTPEEESPPPIQPQPPSSRASTAASPLDASTNAPPAASPSNGRTVLLALAVGALGAVAASALIGSSQSDGTGADAARATASGIVSAANRSEPSVPTPSHAVISAADATATVSASTTTTASAPVAVPPPPANKPAAPRYVSQRHCKQVNGACMHCCPGKRDVLTANCVCMRPVCTPSEAADPLGNECIIR